MMIQIVASAILLSVLLQANNTNITLTGDPAALIGIVGTIIATVLFIIRQFVKYYVDKETRRMNSQIKLAEADTDDRAQLIRAIYNLAENLGKANELAAKDRENASVERTDLIGAVKIGNKAVSAIEIKLEIIEKLANTLASDLVVRISNLGKTNSDSNEKLIQEISSIVKEVNSLRSSFEEGIRNIENGISRVPPPPTELNATVTIKPEEKND